MNKKQLLELIEQADDEDEIFILGITGPEPCYLEFGHIVEDNKGNLIDPTHPCTPFGTLGQDKPCLFIRAL